MLQRYKGGPCSYHTSEADSAETWLDSLARMWSTVWSFQQSQTASLNRSHQLLQSLVRRNKYLSRNDILLLHSPEWKFKTRAMAGRLKTVSEARFLDVFVWQMWSICQASVCKPSKSIAYNMVPQPCRKAHKVTKAIFKPPTIAVKYPQA